MSLIQQSNSSSELNPHKGYMAQQIVRSLFQESGYNVFNFEAESMLPAGIKPRTTKKDKFIGAFRCTPDFVVQSRLNGHLFYIEVKFRPDGFFKFDETYTDYPYQNAWFVIVSPGRIQPLHFKRLAEGRVVSASTWYSFCKIKRFHINPDLLMEYQLYCSQLFTGLNPVHDLASDPSA